VKALEAGGIY